MLKDANGGAVPKLSAFLPTTPTITPQRQAELKQSITGQMFSYSSCRLMGRDDLAEKCQQRVMAAVAELIEAGAL